MSNNLKDNTNTSVDASKPGLLTRLINNANKAYNYCIDGVWNETRRSFKVDFIKTISLSVRSFLNTDLQMRAGYLTYQTLLAVVPALALVFAIGRGFGFQDLLQQELVKNFPAQREVLRQAFTFVDSYLEQSSEGVFVGIGILFLLYTLISLISSVEDCFNTIWGLKSGRTIWRKLTDYTAIFLVLPILMICSSGIMVFMSTALRTILPFGFLSPFVKLILDFASIALIWLFFAGSYMLIPNTKVKFKNALLAGVMAGTAYAILQWLFLSGQIYVTRYNAIYGSFAFLPLLLIWLQFVWLITLAGGVVCFSSQNIFEFSFTNEVGKISNNYKWRLTLAVMAISVDRFLSEKRPLTPHSIAVDFGLPITLVNDACHKLVAAGLLQRVMVAENPDDEFAVAPAIDPAKITVGLVLERVNDVGTTNFIPDFDTRFSELNRTVSQLQEAHLSSASKVLLSTLKIAPVTQSEISPRDSNSETTIKL